MTRSALLAAALALCGAVWAQSPQRAEVMQKAAFVKRLLEAGQPASAADAGAAALYARALEHLERSEHGEADARLSEAIRSLQRARRPSSAATQYAALVSSVETMRDTYARYAGTKRDLHGTLVFEVNQALARARELQGADPNAALRELARVAHRFVWSGDFRCRFGCGVGEERIHLVHRGLAADKVERDAAEE